jgi:predicted  nucleic acid-binding Zn-ribbon protein
MLTPLLENLLILQDRDARRMALEAQIKAIPRDVAAVEQKIAAEKAAIETARIELRELESRKKLLETEIGSTEETLGKYKTQQSQVRKNDEYQALGHQIETTEKTIAGLEEQELETMYAIDGAKQRFAAAEAELKANISGHESRIRTLHERAASLTGELQAAQAEVTTARTPVGEPALRVYDRIAARNTPAIVSVRGDKCGGCHLKVSSEVESAIRGKGVDGAGQLVTCDQCGRIVYRET